MKDKRVNSKGKYSPHKKSTRDLNELSKMVHSNSKYLSVPHGVPDQKSLEDRNRIYAQRSSNPITIPSRITDIPG